MLIKFRGESGSLFLQFWCRCHTGAENNGLLGMPVNFLELPGKFWYEFMLVLPFHDV